METPAESSGEETTNNCDDHSFDDDNFETNSNEEIKKDEIYIQEITPVQSVKKNTSGKLKKLYQLIRFPSLFKTFKIMLGCELILVIFTVIATVISRGSTVHTSIPARLFFPRYSLVTDYYNGNLGKFTEKLLGSDLSMVLYYAPWDRQCQDFQPHFTKVAKYHHEQISFMAVNCWHPGSDCRNQYKVSRFPVIVLYIRDSHKQDSRVVTYEGPLESGHIIRFLTQSLRPLVHISNQLDLAKLQLEHSGIVISYFNSSRPGAKKLYNEYYYAALKSLQYDQHLSLSWGVITDSNVATALTVADTSLHLVLWNSTIVLRDYINPDSKTISNWVYQRFHEVASWIYISQRKSRSFNNFLQEGPVLLLLIPDNPNMKSNDPFTLLKSISLDYFNCQDSVRVKQLSGYLAAHSAKGRSNLRAEENKCRAYIKKALQNPILNPEESSNLCCCHRPQAFKNTGMFDIGTSSSHFLNIFRLQDLGILQLVHDWMTGESDCNEPNPGHSMGCPPSHVHCPCNHTVSTESTLQNPTSAIFEADIHQDFENKGGPSEDDLIIKMIDRSSEDTCKRLLHGLDLSPPSLLKETSNNNDKMEINGLSCRTNKTLTMIALDSLRHQDLALRMGVNLTRGDPSNTAAIILDSRQQQHFVLDRGLSQQSLVSFILNYTRGLLDRNFINDQIVTEECGPESICIMDVNLHKYLEMIDIPGQVTVALHYTNTCGACNIAGHTLLSVAKILDNMSNITIVRIDVASNTLPWHMNFPALPTIIYHPAHRKAETRIFDNNLPLNTKNLMSFLIANLGIEHRLSLALSTCIDNCPENLLQEVSKATTTLHENLSSSLRNLQNMNKLSHGKSKPKSSTRNNLKLQSLSLPTEEDSMRRREYLSRKVVGIRDNLAYLANISVRIRDMLSHRVYTSPSRTLTNNQTKVNKSNDGVT